MIKMPFLRTAVFLVVSALAAPSAVASDPIPAPRQKKPIALIGGTLYTVSGAVLPGATVVFDRGVITAVGMQVEIPENADRIDVSGKNIYPGLIDSYTTMGLTEIGSVRGTIDHSETGTINPNARVEVAVHPESELIPVARSGGIAITGTAPRGGLIPGTSAAMMMDGWTWEEMTLQAPVGLLVHWPAMVYVESRFSRRTREEWLKDRDERLKMLYSAFADARAYAVAKKSGKAGHDSDLRWEAMIPALEGRLPVWVHATELSQIQAAIAWAEQEGLRLVLVGGGDAWKIRDELKKRNIPVVIVDVLNSPGRRWEDYDLIYRLPQLLHEAGVRFSIAGDTDPSNARNLNHHAAAAVAFGLDPAEALRAITLGAAEVMGIDSLVGSIEVGKDATLVIVEGDLLELSSVVESMYIQGKSIDLRDRHKQLYRKYQEKYRQWKDG